MGQTAQEELFLLRVTCGICSGVAILTTLVRIIVRVRRQSKIWVDDALAVFSMAALITQLVALVLNPAHYNGVVRYYLTSNMFYAAIWSARLSILFSLIRITRRLQSNCVLYTFGALFLITWFVLTAQIYWECEPRPAWKKKPVAQCDLSIAVAICQIVADVVSDGVLLIAPIRIFMSITDRKLRYRVMVIFSTCIVTTIVSLVHAAYIFQSKSYPILIAASVESAVSLIVCNIPIMVTALINFQEKKRTRISNKSATIPVFRKSFGTSPSAPPAVARNATSLISFPLSDLSVSNNTSIMMPTIDAHK